jgi:hypothetical protein
MYYTIELDWDPKVIGVKNGIYQVELEKKLYDPESYKLLNSFFHKEFTAKQEYPDFDFIFHFKELKSAKKTSLMGYSPNLNHCQFLLSIDALQIMKRFNIQHFKVYPAIIYDSQLQNTDNSYRMFYSVLQDWNVIDFKKTVFTSGGYGNNPIVEHSFDNENEFKSFNGILVVKTLSLSEDFDTSLDYFQTRLGGNFISEKLKITLEESNLTGMLFRNAIQVITK